MVRGRLNKGGGGHGGNRIMCKASRKSMELQLFVAAISRFRALFEPMPSSHSADWQRNP
jgi:hypothetical protein